MHTCLCVCVFMRVVVSRAQPRFAMPPFSHDAGPHDHIQPCCDSPSGVARMCADFRVPFSRKRNASFVRATCAGTSRERCAAGRAYLRIGWCASSVAVRSGARLPGVDHTRTPAQRRQLHPCSVMRRRITHRYRSARSHTGTASHPFSRPRVGLRLYALQLD